MSKRAEEAALKAYPVEMTPLNYQDLIEQFGGKTEIDTNSYPRLLFREGYEQAEKDLELTKDDVWCIFNLVREFQVKYNSTDGCLQEVADVFNKTRKE